MKKKCTKCGEIKDETKFPWWTAKHKKRRPQCQACRNALQKRWVKKNQRECAAKARRYAAEYKKRDLIGYRRRRRSADLKNKFGITIEQYEVILSAQNSLCAICGKPETISHKGKLIELAVDHDHAANKVRALLCNRCNQAIGLMQENPERLEKAAAYLRYHKK